MTVTRVLCCCAWLTLASAGDLSHLTPTAFSQQSFNIGHYAPHGYDDTHNAYTGQGGSGGGGGGGGYQVQEVANNHIGYAASQQGHFDASSVELTQNGVTHGSDVPQANGATGGADAVADSYGNVQQHQSDAFDASQGHVDDYNSQQVLHAPAETFPISKHVEITKNVPYPVYKQVHVPVERPVQVQIPHPVLVPQPQPYPIEVPVAKPYAVPVVKEITIPIQKIVPYPVVKKVPYTVERHVPYHVERFVTVHKKVPYAVKVPIVKTIIHRVDSHSHGHYSGGGGGSSHGRSYTW